MRAQALASYMLAGFAFAALGAACSLSSNVEEIFAEGSVGGGGAGGRGGNGGAPGTSSSSSSSGGGQGGAGATTSSSSGGGPSVFCNGSPCAAGQSCCFRALDPSLSMCAAPGSCEPGFIELSCNDPTDCPGETCCGNWNGQTYTGVSCQEICEGFSKIVQCEGHPEVCPQGTTCNESGILGMGYSFCQ